MSSAPATRLVAAREIRERLQSRLLRIMTVITALIVVLAIVIPALVSGGSATAVKVGLVGTRAQSLASTIARRARAADVKVALVDVPSVPAGRSAVRRGTLDVALSVGASGAVAEVKQSLSPLGRAVIGSALDTAHLRAALAQAGVQLGKVLPALAPVPLTTRALSPPPTDSAGRDVAAIAAGLLMYVSLVVYGGAVANGVAQEKTSRTAEVLLATVRPGQLLAGKVAGIGLTGLGQVAIAVAAGLVANALVHSAHIPSSVWALLPAFLGFFLLGFALYAFAFAAAGALVARQEEVQFVSMPFSLLLLGGYLLAYAAVSSPDATWLRILSFLPPLTATLMPARIALGHVAWWEVPLVIVLMVLSIYGMWRLASRIYAPALVRGGARIGWRAALRQSAR